MQISDKHPSIDLTVQQEQPIPPLALVAASQDANTTMTTPKHKGTLYPDVSILRYVLDHPTLPQRMNDSNLHYLILAELKRSIRRQFILEGIDDKSPGYGMLSNFLRRACTQATRQAYVAIQRTEAARGSRGIILIAASGPFWMWCQASYTAIKASFRKPLQDILDDAQDDRDADDDDEVVDNDASDSDKPFTSSSTGVLHVPLTKEVIFGTKIPLLAWSEVIMLDTQRSCEELAKLNSTLLGLLRSETST